MFNFTKKTRINALTLLLCFAAFLLQMVSCSSSGDNLKLIPVKTGEKWGYVNKAGKYIINPQFAEASSIENGLALVQTMDGKYGFINEKGKFVINPQFSDAKQFKDGFSLVEADGKSGFINKEGKYVIGPFECEDALSFSEGLAFVSPYDSGPVCYDTKGNVKFELSEVAKVYPFNEGMARIVDVEGNYGFIDKNGTVIVNPQFKYAEDFSEGLAAFEQNGTWGYIDKKGKIVINPQFDNAFSFDDGVAAVVSGRQCGVIDKKGNYVINPQFDNVVEFSEGMAAFKSGEMYGFVNKKGEIVINPQFMMAGNFKNGLAVVVSNNEKCGYINKKGEYVITPQFRIAMDFIDDIAIVELNEKEGIIDKQGKYIVNPQFDNIAVDLIKKNSSVLRELYEMESKSRCLISSYAVNINTVNTVMKSLFDGDDPCAFSATVNTFADYDNEVVSKYEIKATVGDMEMTGYFKTPIYHEVKAYERDRWGDRYETKKREYHFDDTAGVIKFGMETDDLGRNINPKTLALLLVKQLEAKYGINMEKDNNGMYVWFNAANEKGLGVKGVSYYLDLYFIQDKSVYDRENPKYGF